MYRKIKNVTAIIVNNDLSTIAFERILYRYGLELVKVTKNERTYKGRMPWWKAYELEQKRWLSDYGYSCRIIIM